MSKKVIFRPTSEKIYYAVNSPKPAKAYIPKWYKDVPKFEDHTMTRTTIKGCMPFLDSLTSGYIQETWCDLYVESTDDSVTWNFPDDITLVEDRKGKNRYAVPDEFLNFELNWQQPWIPQLPKGYSMIYTHPFNRQDLPFLSVSAIIDNDNFYMENQANHPFFIKRGFTGIIPKGTPMYQMIPIKRDRWTSETQEFDKELFYRFRSVRQFFNSGYRNMYWQKKEYR
jgi:hypothetical protein